MKTCIRCGHKVGQGDQHARYACPPRAKGADSVRRKRKLRVKRKAKRDGFIPQRGQPVAGTGVPKGDA